MLSRKVEETTTLALTAIAVGESTRPTTADSRTLLVTSVRKQDTSQRCVAAKLSEDNAGVRKVLVVEEI